MTEIEQLTVETEVKKRGGVEGTNEHGKRRHSVSSAESASSFPRRGSMSPNSPGLRRVSVEGDDLSLSQSPMQKELRKMHRAASTLAIALTESHDSDEEYDNVTVSDEEEEEEVEILGISNADDLRKTEASNHVHFNDQQMPMFSAKARRGSRLHLGEKMVADAIQPMSSISSDSLQMLDELDRKLSLPIYRFDLGVGFEYLMLIFGTWFGLPVPAWGLWTATFAFLDEKALLYAMDEERATITASLIVLAFACYIFFFVRWISKAKYQRVYGNLKQLASIPILFFVVFHYGSLTGGYNAGSFFVCTWVIAEVLGHLLKYVLKRFRPVAYLPAKDLAKRHFPDVQAMFSKGHTAFESFPSADTIGGAVFCCTLLKMEMLPPPAGIGLSLVIAFSRIYLQAHHLFDVAVGLILGWSTCLAMWYGFGEYRVLGRWHSVFAVLFFVVFALIARKFKRVLPKHLERPKSMYGF